MRPLLKSDSVSLKSLLEQSSGDPQADSSDLKNYEVPPVLTFGVSHQF